MRRLTDYYSIKNNNFKGFLKEEDSLSKRNRVDEGYLSPARLMSGKESASKNRRMREIEAKRSS